MANIYVSGHSGHKLTSEHSNTQTHTADRMHYLDHEVVRNEKQNSYLL